MSTAQAMKAKSVSEAKADARALAKTEAALDAAEAEDLVAAEGFATALQLAKSVGAEVVGSWKVLDRDGETLVAKAIAAQDAVEANALGYNDLVKIAFVGCVDFSGETDPLKFAKRESERAASVHTGDFSGIGRKEFREAFGAVIIAGGGRELSEKHMGKIGRHHSKVALVPGLEGMNETATRSLPMPKIKGGAVDAASVDHLASIVAKATEAAEGDLKPRDLKAVMVELDAPKVEASKVSADARKSAKASDVGLPTLHANAKGTITQTQAKAFAADVKAFVEGEDLAFSKGAAVIVADALAALEGLVRS